MSGPAGQKKSLYGPIFKSGAIMIVDQFGNPIDTGALRDPQTAKLGHLVHEFENHPARGLTPARLARILQAAEEGDWLDQLDLADDLEERDAHIYAEMSKRKGAIVRIEWSIQPPKNPSAQEKKWAEQLTEWVTSIADFEDLLLGMMDASLKAFSAHEMLWTLEDGALMPTTIDHRPQRWFVQTKDRQSFALRDNSQYGEALRPFSWIAHKHRARSGYLARGSLARVLAWPYLFKNYAVRDLAEFLELYGIPPRIGKYPSGATPEEKATLMRAVVSIGHNAAGIIPQGMELEFQKAAEGSEAGFLAQAAYMDAASSKAILGQTLTAGEGQHGTQALGTVHNEVRHDIRDSDARQVAATLTRQLLWPLAALNIAGVTLKRCPRFAFDTGEADDVAAFADSAPKLVSLGMRIGRQWAHDKLRIPMAADDEPILQAAQPATATPNGTPPDPNATTQAKAALRGAAPAPAPAPDAIDAAIDGLADNWRPMLAPMVDPVMAELDAALAAGESLEQFRVRLDALAARMDAGPLAERLARAAFGARLAGEADIDLSGDEL